VAGLLGGRQLKSGGHGQGWLLFICMSGVLSSGQFPTAPRFGALHGSFLLLAQVLERLLQGKDSLRDFVQTEAIGSFPLARFVKISHFQDDFGQRNLLALAFNGVAEDRSSDSSYFENFFWFGHFPVFPAIDLIYLYVSIDKTIGVYKPFG
jgi:hypothetical protein